MADKEVDPTAAGTTPAGDGPEEQDKLLFGQELTPRERRAAALLALGYTDTKIGRQLVPGSDVFTTSTVGSYIQAACAKLGVGRHGLIIWILNNLSDEDRDRMVQAAKRRRDQLRASGVLRPVRVQIAMMLGDPATCELSAHDLGQRLDPKLTGAQVSAHMRKMYDNIGPDGGLTKLVAIMHLAPLSDRSTTDDDVDEDETL